MKHHSLTFLLAGLLLATSAQATQADHIRASQAWIRVLPGDLPAGAYVVLENGSDKPAKLSAADSTAFAGVMLHQSSNAGGMDRMSMLDSLTIPAHGKAELAPGGYHLMLTKPAQPVHAGDTVKISLHFGDGSSQNVDFLVRPANATGP